MHVFLVTETSLKKQTGKYKICKTNKLAFDFLLDKMQYLSGDGLGPIN